MSELRVALVAEGQTDAVVIEAALKALLPRPFILTQVQPEPLGTVRAEEKKLGTGWGGVVRWCLQAAGRGATRLEEDPTLPGFDLFVLQIDADVAEFRYADVAPEVAAQADKRGWPVLPSPHPCPPPEGSVDAMRKCLLAWSGFAAWGPRTVLCVPSKAIESWLAAAVLDSGHKLVPGLECNLNLAKQLASLPKAERVKKSAREYRARAGEVTKRWAIVRQRCSQAERFSVDVEAVTR